MPITTHHAAVLVCSIAVAVAASPLLFRSRPSHVIQEGSFADQNGVAGLGGARGPSGTPIAPSLSAQAHVQHVDGLMSELDTLFVLDPNFFLCWESILIDDSTKNTLLPWVSSLKDVFTRSSENPAGLELLVRHTAFSALGDLHGVYCDVRSYHIACGSYLNSVLPCTR